MGMADMPHLVKEDVPPVGLDIPAADYDVMHPAVRVYGAVVSYTQPDLAPAARGFSARGQEPVIFMRHRNPGYP